MLSKAIDRIKEKAKRGNPVALSIVSKGLDHIKYVECGIHTGGHIIGDKIYKVSTFMTPKLAGWRNDKVKSFEGDRLFRKPESLCSKEIESKLTYVALSQNQITAIEG